ncbi:cyclic GMP-AMP synthase DncV-like nucleotidyltransferase [Coleofasciculus sp. FACHB-501]|uniref:cyclic GMP-AMP synthase DncV-like nucleotidyltransferase n=1 Tax=Cyanophyceae TaxID=3028117 RepID=UPI001686FD5B|nr:nucleotidyltransferase [Coleofasciculus sp. FACHB-501]MBD1836628.1 nucleotidyltransferase [Coleofasciculus sp. FACHB-501]
MVNLQSQFISFYNTIKLDFDDNKLLRDKRDLIVNNLRYGLKNNFPVNTPTFNHFNQGSYDLATGVYPLSGQDYDIDVGIIFNFSKNIHLPVKVKEWVYNALNTGTRTVEIKRPCVRVQYHENGKKSFHVDLAIYSVNKGYWEKEVYHIAKGFVGSSEDKKIWELSEPFRLKELLKSKIIDNSDREQFRRIIRYLKRWKDYCFSSIGAERPTGIALTACCYNLFTPQKDYIYSTKYYQYNYQYNDLQALHHVVNGMISMFNYKNQISVNLPVQPYNDLFAKMSNNQMILMKTKLITLRDTLLTASNEPASFKACTKLRKVFGDDFPIL